MLNEKKQLFQHVRYEYTRFVAASNYIVYGHQEIILHDLVIESFLLHTRSLYEFFVCKKKKKYPDDLRIGDFLADKPEFNLKYIEKNKWRLDQHLSHISKTRVTKKDSWDIEKIRNEIDQAWQIFVNKLKMDNPNLIK